LSFLANDESDTCLWDAQKAGKRLFTTPLAAIARLLT
jgi:hypothetical protein